MESSPLMTGIPPPSQDRFRKQSYGTFLPVYVLDTTAIRRLLPAVEDGFTVIEFADLSSPPEEDEQVLSDCDEQVLSDCDSIIGEDDQLPTGVDRRAAFLAVCGKQFQQLYQFVEENLSQVKMELEVYDDRAPATPTDIRRLSLDEEQRNAKSLEESASFLGDSGIEEDHMSSARGVMQRLRRVLAGLMENLQSASDTLDELLGIYDQRTDTCDGANLSEEHRFKRTALRDQLKQGIKRIDVELARLNGEKSGVDTLKEARKQYFSVRYLLAFLLLMATMGAVTYMAVMHIHTRWTIFLRLMRGPIFIAYYCFLLGFNMMVWARTDINYLSAFKFPLGASPTPKAMFNMGSFFTILFSILVLIFLFLSDYAFFIADKVLALFMWMLLLLFLVNPINKLMRRGRFSFLIVQTRILISPFIEVFFCDNWFADQMNSLVALIVDVEYLMCYCISSPWIVGWDTTVNSDDSLVSLCTKSGNGIRPLLFCLPALWRFLQCLRASYDERKLEHLVNAGKYATTFLVVILAAVYSTKVHTHDDGLDFSLLKPFGWTVVILLFLSALLNTGYCFLWDVLQDWHLCRSGCLRPRLYFSRKWYFIAIVLDFAIRFANALKLILGVAYHIAPELVFTALVLAEATRRFIWNFFRVEWEQIKNSRLAPALDNN